MYDFALSPIMQQPCLNDNSYNITKQLAKKLEFLYHVGRYLEDARKAGDAKAEMAWQKIRADEEIHADILRSLLISEAKTGKL